MCGLSTNPPALGRGGARTVRAVSLSGARCEGGVFLPFVAMGLISILAFIGLAVDSARVYRAAIELQQAVDAAGISAARVFVNAPGASLAADAEKAYRDSVDIIASNLLAGGMSAGAVADIADRIDGQFVSACLNQNSTCCFTPGQPFVCSMNASDERRFLLVKARMKVRTLILGIIPGVGRATMVEAYASMENLKMQAVLVLDRSGSMTDNWSGQTKGAFLKTAAKAFVDTMQPFDELGIVSFSSTVDAAPANLYANEPYQETNNLALLRANYQNDSFDVYPASGGQGLVQIGAGNNVKQAAKNAIDAITFSGNTDIGSGLWRGRKRLDDAGPMAANVLRLIVLVTDGAPNGAANNYLPVTWWSRGERPLAPCTSPLIGTPNDQNQTPPQQRLRALDAIIESDLARDQNYVVFTIGLGEEDPNLTSPFQNVNNTSLLKRFLLRRIANDQPAMRALTPAPNGFNPADPAYPWDFPCMRRGSVIASQPVGQYLPANTGQALLDAFLQVAAVRSRLQP